MKRHCQGFCGGYVSVPEIRIIDGEHYCPKCAKRYKEKYMNEDENEDEDNDN